MLQQNEKFSQIEEKYRSLHGKTSSLFDMEEEIVRVSKKVRLIDCGADPQRAWTMNLQILMGVNVIYLAIFKYLARR